jgi:hypothetical protein
VFRLDRISLGRSDSHAGGGIGTDGYQRTINAPFADATMIYKLWNIPVTLVGKIVRLEPLTEALVPELAVVGCDDCIWKLMRYGLIRNEKEMHARVKNLLEGQRVNIYYCDMLFRYLGRSGFNSMWMCVTNFPGALSSGLKRNARRSFAITTSYRMGLRFGLLQHN